MLFPRLKAFLVAALAASMLVGCAEIPTGNQNQQTQGEENSGSELPAVTSQSVKDFLSEFQQSLNMLQTISGANKDIVSAASGYRINGFSIAQASDQWAWQDKAPEPDGTVESTRQIIERDAAGNVVTDIQSTRRVKGDMGSTMTISQVEIVTKSPVMRPGTYQIEGERQSTSEPEFRMVGKQTTTFTPLEGGPEFKVVFQREGSSGLSTLKASGTLPDGTKVSYESIMKEARESSSMTDYTAVTEYTVAMSLTDSLGKVFSMDIDSRTDYSGSGGNSSSEGKSQIDVAMGGVMKIRFNADMLSTLKNGSDFKFERFNLTADLLDGQGKLLSPILLDIPEGTTQPSNTGIITLAGEEPTDLDMRPVFSLMNLQLGLQI